MEELRRRLDDKFYRETYGICNGEGPPQEDGGYLVPGNFFEPRPAIPLHRFILETLLDFWEEWWGMILVGALIAAFVFLMFCAYQEGKAWDAFARENGCVEFGTRPGVPITTYIHSGNMLIPITMPTTDHGYRCNDGREYWR